MGKGADNGEIGMGGKGDGYCRIYMCIYVYIFRYGDSWWIFQIGKMGRAKFVMVLWDSNGDDLWGNHDGWEDGDGERTG